MKVVRVKIIDASGGFGGRWAIYADGELIEVSPMLRRDWVERYVKTDLKRFFEVLYKQPVKVEVIEE